MEHTENSKSQITFAQMHIFDAFCVKLTQICENCTSLLCEDPSWSKSQITKHIYTLFSMDDRWKLPKRDVTVYREGLLYKCQTGKIRNWGNGQDLVKFDTYFVKMSFQCMIMSCWYKCALTSHFVNFCEFEFSVRSSMVCLQGFRLFSGNTYQQYVSNVS